MIHSSRYLILAFLMLFFRQGFAQKKNVLFIMADDFNWWLPAIGYYDQALTPNLDKLAREGVLFMDASSASPVCNPSRNALLSGLRPSTSGISTNGGGYIRDKAEYHNVVTMNQAFLDQGYYVYGGGKLYHPGKMGNHKTDPDHWSEIYEGRTGSRGGNIYEWKSKNDGLFQWGAGEFDVETANDTRLARAIATKIKSYDGDQPFFIGAGLFRPHLPWRAHRSFFDLYDPDSLPTPKGYLENDAQDIPINYNGREEYDEITSNGVYQEALRAYLANLSYCDFNVGIMLEALAESEHRDNTIVVFTGDHGWHLGEKDRFSKHAVFDMASRTTFIIYDPSAKGNGEKCAWPVSLQDIYPTLLELCDLEKPIHVEGNSLQPLLEAPSQQNWDQPILMTYAGTNIIKTKKWRLIDHQDPDKRQLYNMVDDPYEWENLYGREGYTATDPVVTRLLDQMKHLVGNGVYN